MATFPIRRGNKKVGSAGFEPIADLCHLLRPHGSSHSVEPVACLYGANRRSPLFPARRKRRK
jgi:hypothetical protein